MMRCISLIFNFPHNDDEECRNVLDEMVKCIGPKVSSCLDSSCPSLFDGVPGLRSQYSEISFFASNTKTIDEIIALVRNTTGLTLCLLSTTLFVQLIKMMSMHLLTYFRIMHLMWTNLSQPPSLNLHVPMLSLVFKITDFNFLETFMLHKPKNKFSKQCGCRVKEL